MIVADPDEATAIVEFNLDRAPIGMIRVQKDMSVINSGHTIGFFRQDFCALQKCWCVQEMRWDRSLPTVGQLAVSIVTVWLQGASDTRRSPSPREPRCPVNQSDGKICLVSRLVDVQRASQRGHPRLVT